MPTEDLKAIIERMTEELWHQGNLDAVEKYIAPNYVGHDPSGTSQGIEAVKNYIAGVRSMIPDVRYTLDDFVAEGEKVAARWTLRGTHLGTSPTFGVPATGKRMEFWGISIYHVIDGRIVEDWGAWDMLGMLQQLGVIPPMGQGEG